MTDGFIPAPIAQLPWRLLLLVIALGGFGTIVLYSAAGGHLWPWALNHAVRFSGFLFLACLMSQVREEFWLQAAYPLYIIVLVLLIGVEVVGGVSGGSRRWLDIGIRLQPSELMKLAMVLATARFYAQLPAGEVRGWNALWPAGLLIVFPVALVASQPDLGTSIMIMVGGIVVMFLAGLPLRLFVGSALAVAALVPIVFSRLHGYQQDRVLIFLDPEKDPLGKGYHITQSKIAIGSGGIFGKGFLQGTQSHLEYLPEKQTDFVFATMAEEWGLLGGLFIITCYVMIARWGMRVAARAGTRFSRLVAGGLTMTIFFYVLINLLMVMGLAPVVGIPLPMVSHGGTAMLTVMLCLGILMSIERHNRHRPGL